MNKLNTGIVGGMPIKQSAFELIQDNIEIVGKTIVESLLNGSTNQIKLNGLTVTLLNAGSANPTITVTSGYVWYDGYIYQFDGIADFPLPSGYTLSDFYSNYYLDKAITEDAAVTYKNGSSHNYYIREKVILTNAPTIFTDLKVNCEFLSTNLTTDPATTSTYGTIILSDNINNQNPVSDKVLTPKNVSDSITNITLSDTTKTKTKNSGVKNSYLKKVQIGNMILISGELYLEQLIDSTDMEITLSPFLPNNDFLPFTYNITVLNGSFIETQVIGSDTVTTHPYLNLYSIYYSSTNSLTFNFFNSQTGGSAKTVKAGTTITFYLNKIYFL